MKWTLNDIAGYDEEKKELEGIIDMFKNYSVYRESGAYLSKGLIISGSPGVGKTLFARVLADEIGSPFYCIDGADIDGVPGVRDIKQVFSKARDNAPSVVFIDELNKLVGDARYSTDYTNRNLSVLLKLIDGIKADSGVFVIGATSDKYKLDPAIMRSGRMDKHICLDFPNFESRLAIFKYYMSSVNLPTEQVNYRRIAEKMRGFNGADIKTLVNETILECVHKGISPNDMMFLSHIRKIGSQDIDRKSNVYDESFIAYHDIGHLLVSNALRGTYDDITIEFAAEATGNSSISSIFDDSDDDDDYDDDKDVKIRRDSKSMLLDKVAVLLGGAAAEDVLLNERYVTSSNDLTAAIQIINMGFASGLFGFEYVNHDTYYYVEVSQRMLEQMDALRIRILSEQYERAKKIISDNKSAAQSIYAALMRRKVLTRAQVCKLIEGEAA
ncbi:MAG: AAA family ATPase [Clostridiales bacterium]|nr:AAA family ATPase [Clostridiales bacterium]